jgi:hypothetical protein
VEVDVGERAESPAPEDREFEDDDGTIYQWDPQLRKFQAKEVGGTSEGGGGAGYGMDEMTFEANEEIIPELPEVVPPLPMYPLHMPKPVDAVQDSLRYQVINRPQCTSVLL